MTTATLFSRYELTPCELQDKQNEVKRLARQWLDPDHFAELLLDRCYDNLGKAISELTYASYVSLQMQFGRGELDADMDMATVTDARRGFTALVQHFGKDCMLALAHELVPDDDPDDDGGEAVATRHAA